MEKEFVPYEQALALKELGFDSKEFISWVFVDTNNIFFESNGFCPNSSIWAPTFSQAFRWFRKKYDYDSYFFSNTSYRYRIVIKKIYTMESMFDIMTDTYEEAELECLKKLIEIVK